MDAKAKSRTQGAALLEWVDYRPVDTPDYRDEVYQLRYRAYLDAGLIEPSETQRVCDKYEDAPNTWTFGVHVDGELCASIRLHLLTSEWRMSYTPDLFGDIVRPRLDRGDVFIDVSRFVADPEKSRKHPEIALLTLRIGVLACDHFGVDTAFAMVRSDHQGLLSPLLRARSAHRRHASVPWLAQQARGADGVRLQVGPQPRSWPAPRS